MDDLDRVQAVEEARRQVRLEQLGRELKRLARQYQAKTGSQPPFALHVPPLLYFDVIDALDEVSAPTLFNVVRDPSVTQPELAR